MFNIIIVNLDKGSYLRMTPEKALAKAEKEKKDLYLQACLDHRRTFTPMVYSADRIPGAEALTEQKRLAAVLMYKLKQEYSEMCGFVKGADVTRDSEIQQPATPWPSRQRGVHSEALGADGRSGDGTARALSWLDLGRQNRLDRTG